MAYNAAIANESKTKFPRSVDCRTTHSLAYANVVKNFGLEIGAFKFYSVKEHIEYEEKQLVVSLLEKFSQSEYINIDDFYNGSDIGTKDNKKYFELTRKYFNKMVSGKIRITFNAMLKFYHILLAKGKIKHKPFDIIMLDESGDLNMVTIEILKLLPSPLKLVVGDKYQSIYGFNGTVNGFKELDGESLTLNMTKTFRCSKAIAEDIQIFCNNHLDKKMNFVGINEPPETFESKSRAYIARTNSTLVAKMIQLDETKTPYNLTRPAKSIFEFMLFLLFLKESHEPTHNPDYQHIQDAYNEYTNDNELKKKYKNFFKYASEQFADDVNFLSSVATISKYSRSQIFDTYNNAKAHENNKNVHYLTLGTGHSLKGQEYDVVELADDVRSAFNKCVENKDKLGFYSEDNYQELNLIYVMISRAKHKIENADWAFK